MKKANAFSKKDQDCIHQRRERGCKYTKLVTPALGGGQAADEAQGWRVRKRALIMENEHEKASARQRRRADDHTRARRKDDLGAASNALTNSVSENDEGGENLQDQLYRGIHFGNHGRSAVLRVLF